MARRLEQTTNIKMPVFIPMSVRRQFNFDVPKPPVTLPPNQSLIQQAGQKRYISNARNHGFEDKENFVIN